MVDSSFIVSPLTPEFSDVWSEPQLLSAKGHNAIYAATRFGRKNYLFCGNHEAAGWMSVICSLIGTCKEHHVNPRLYLNDVIAKMPYVTANPLKSPTKSQLRQLLPHVWIQSHPEALLDASNQ